MASLEPYFKANQLEAGCDEAGRGCMAGPVVAAAVILPPDFHHPWLDDSKKLTEKKRDLLRPIIEKEAISWKVSFVDHEKIDKINILNASILGMQQAALALEKRPEAVLIDGNRFHKFEIPHYCFVKGDGIYRSIAAASILAKTHRDEYMEKLHHLHPEYHWLRNKGYPTQEHRDAIIQLGLSPYHRKTFQLKDAQQLVFPFGEI